jgi:hypothetical protein
MNNKIIFIKILKNKNTHTQKKILSKSFKLFTNK